MRASRSVMASLGQIEALREVKGNWTLTGNVLPFEAIRGGGPKAIAWRGLRELTYGCVRTPVFLLGKGRGVVQQAGETGLHKGPLHIRRLGMLLSDHDRVA